MMAIIEYALRLAEESTNIPLISQGQSGKTTPDTFGATQLQNNNANQLLRSIGYTVDDYITAPVVDQSYEWLLLDDTVPDDEKGDWNIDAHGSAALVERAIQDQTIAQMGQMVLNPAYGANPKLWFAEFSKTRRLDPKTFQYSAEDQAKIDSKPAAPAPAVQAAQIRAEVDKLRLQAEQQALAQEMGTEVKTTQMDNDVALKIADKEAELSMLRVKRDTDRDSVYAQAESQRTQIEHDGILRELEIKREIAMLDYANKRELKLEDVKSQLAQTAMRLNVQKELSSLAHKVDLHKHAIPSADAVVAVPPTEPVGRAKPGEAFEA